MRSFLQIFQISQFFLKMKKVSNNYRKFFFLLFYKGLNLDPEEDLNIKGTILVQFPILIQKIV